jgi:hypothetical protein
VTRLRRSGLRPILDSLCFLEFGLALQQPPRL